MIYNSVVNLKSIGVLDAANTLKKSIQKISKIILGYNYSKYPCVLYYCNLPIQNESAFNFVKQINC